MPHYSDWERLSPKRTHFKLTQPTFTISKNQAYGSFSKIALETVVQESDVVCLFHNSQTHRIGFEFHNSQNPHTPEDGLAISRSRVALKSAVGNSGIKFLHRQYPIHYDSDSGLFYINLAGEPVE